MIFLTVGGHTPFDRLVRAVDEWAAARGRDDVLAQIGATRHPPRHIRWVSFLTPVEFAAQVAGAAAIVAHAGTGSIFSAMEHRKPIIVMPRRAASGETRNDHQLATVRAFCARTRVAVAMDEAELSHQLDAIDLLAAAEPIGPFASPRLLQAVREFINAPR